MYKCELCGFVYNIEVTLPFRCGCQAKVVTDAVEINDFSTNTKLVSQPDSFNPLEQSSGTYYGLWKELHTYVITSIEEAKGWFQSFSMKIPCGDCKNHWLKLVKEFPPNFSSQEAFFIWTVQAHNKVNKRLEKPQISLEEARRLWLNF